MGKIRIIGREKSIGPYVNTTSRSKDWGVGLSPFFLGPVNLYDDYKSLNVENAWQFSKLYLTHATIDGNPTERYYEWAEHGWLDSYAHRYPMGKGVMPLCSIWKGKKINYIEGRKQIYIPMYAKAVVRSKAYAILQELYTKEKNITLWDFDGYDYESLGMTFDEVINNPSKKMGHAFVLAMLLEGKITVDKEIVTIQKGGII